MMMNDYNRILFFVNEFFEGHTHTFIYFDYPSFLFLPKIKINRQPENKNQMTNHDLNDEVDDDDDDDGLNYSRERERP